MAEKREDRSSDEIRRDMEGTRAEMHETVDALERKLSPGQMVDDLWNRARDSAPGSAVSDVATTVRDHPLPASLVGLGLAWMAVERARSASSVDTDRLSEEDEGRRRGGDGLARVGHEARDRGRKAERRLRSSMEEQPLVLGAVAFGLGLAGGLALPTSRFEDRTLGETADTVKHEAGEVARDAVEGGKEMAKDAARAARDVVEEQDVSGKMEAAAEQVLDEAKATVRRRARKTPGEKAPKKKASSRKADAGDDRRGE